MTISTHPAQDGHGEVDLHPHSPVARRLAEAVPVGVQVGLDQLGTPLDEATWIVVDLETTGIGTRSAITEIGAVKVHGRRITDQFHTLVNPDQPIPASITALTGISDESVAQCPLITDVYPQFHQWADFDEQPIIVAHNARFDVGFLRRAANACDMTWPRIRIVDTLALARLALPRPMISNHKLGTLAAHFGVSDYDAHRALGDVLATVQVFHGLCDLVSKSGASTVEDLVTLGRPVPPRTRQKSTLADSLPQTPGTYRFVDDAGGTLYVGSARNIRSRVRTYFTASETRRKVRRMLAVATGVEAQSTSTELEARVEELRLIRTLSPLFNSASRRQKATHWVVRRHDRFECVPVIKSHEALDALGPYSTHASAREAIDALQQAGADAMDCDECSVIDALNEQMNQAAGDEHFERAARLRTLLGTYIRGIEQQRIVRALGLARRAVWAHHRSEGGWEIALTSFGRLVRVAVSPPGTSPLPWVEMLHDEDVPARPDVFLTGTTWEETRVLYRDLTRPGARLIEWDGVVPLGSTWTSPLRRDTLIRAVGQARRPETTMN